ncbi:MAG: polyamine aminopropyltransferase [Candidatus Omnitrophota bacterium]
MYNNWYREALYQDMQLGLAIKDTIFTERSKFQRINIYDTYRFGKALVLDGIIQTTEKDEFIYHEMMSHLPLFSHPAPKNILIIGGGDGGILREVLKHPVKKACLVELDPTVISVCKKYLSSICKNAFRDQRSVIIIDDGAEFIKKTQEKFDVVIIDSPDPIGPAKVLFSKTFYKNLKKIITAKGIIVRQSGSSTTQISELILAVRKIKRLFKYVNPYTTSIPTYIGGMFTIVYASPSISVDKLNFHRITTRYAQLKLNARYYNPEIHKASFALPNYIKERMK